MSRVITTLGPEDRPAILAHLLRLSPEDRYTRFFVTLSEDLVQKYVMERMDLSKDWAFGIYEDRRLIAFVHLSNIEKSATHKAAELGISIDADRRGKHVARMLMQRALVRCKAEGIDTLFMSCLGQNIKMQHLARSCGMRVVTEHGEAIADLQLEKYPLERSVCISKDAMYDSISLFDKAYRHNSRLAMDLLAPVYGEPAA